MSDARRPDPFPDDPDGPAPPPEAEPAFVHPWTWDEPEVVEAEPAAEPAYEVVDPVTCWRCGLTEPPDGARCRKCRARLTDDGEPPARSGRTRYARPDASPATDSPLVTLVVAYALMLLVSIVWGWVLLSDGGKMTEDEVLRGTAVVEVIDTVLVLAALARVGWSPLAPVPAGARAWAWVAGVPALLLLLAAGQLYISAIRDLIRPGLEPPGMPVTALAVLLVCVQPAIVEELFFRYAAFGALRRATGLHATVWVSAVMFAGAHLYNPLGTPYLFLAGVVFGYARVWGGLALPMVMHFLHNLAVLFLEAGR